MLQSDRDKPFPCEWCWERDSDTRVRHSWVCYECNPKARRFYDALDGRPDPSWLPKAGEPWLTLHVDGKPSVRVDTYAPRKGTIQNLLPAPSKTGRKPRRDLSPSERLDDLAKRRVRMRRERARIEREARQLVESGEVSGAEVARAFGVSRQRIYQIVKGNT